MAAKPRKNRGIPVSRPALLLQAAGLAGATWLLAAEWPTLVASGSPSALIAAAFFYMLVAWLCAFGMTLWTYMAVSLDRFQDLLVGAARGSIPAMWFVPGMMLVMTPAAPVAIAIGLLMMINAARLVVANPPPQKRMLSRRAFRTSHRLFAQSEVRPGFLARDTTPALMGAVSIQAGSFAIWAGYPQASAALMAGGVASWTWSSMARGAYQPRKRRHALHTVLSVVTALFLAIAFSAVRRTEPAADGGGELQGPLAATRFEVRRLVNPPPEKKAAAASKTKDRVTPLVAPPIEMDALGKGGIPGLVLLPTEKRAQSVEIPPTYRLQITLSPTKPVSIPFTGEYRLFRESSVDLPPGSETRSGSPLDAVYATTNGTAMETDAYQEFDSPVDFTPCGRIQLTITSGEAFPASATLILVGTEREKAAEAGPEIFGLSGSRDETVEFLLPSSQGLHIKGLRVVFRHNPMEASHSTQVAIQRITFLPRTL